MLVVEWQIINEVHLAKLTQLLSVNVCGVSILIQSYVNANIVNVYSSDCIFCHKQNSYFY